MRPTGTKTLNGTDVPFVQLSLRNLSAVPGFQAATCPGGGAPLANTVPVASSSINLTVLYNVTADLLVVRPYAWPWAPMGRPWAR